MIFFILNDVYCLPPTSESNNRRHNFSVRDWLYSEMRWKKSFLHGCGGGIWWLWILHCFYFNFLKTNHFVFDCNCPHLYLFYVERCIRPPEPLIIFIIERTGWGHVLPNMRIYVKCMCIQINHTFWNKQSASQNCNCWFLLNAAFRQNQQPHQWS